MNTKYLQPTADFRKAKYTFAKLLFVLGVPLRVTTSVDSLRIAFIASSYTEYVLRARESFRREQVRMSWLREIVMGGDVRYDIGANVGAYGLSAGKKMKVSQNNLLGLVYAFEPAFSNVFPVLFRMAWTPSRSRVDEDKAFSVASSRSCLFVDCCSAL